MGNEGRWKNVQNVRRIYGNLLKNANIEDTFSITWIHYPNVMILDK